MANIYLDLLFEALGGVIFKSDKEVKEFLGRRIHSDPRFLNTQEKQNSQDFCKSVDVKKILLEK